jgi:cation transport regulator ChaB
MEHRELQKRLREIVDASIKADVSLTRMERADLSDAIHELTEYEPGECRRAYDRQEELEQEVKDLRWKVAQLQRKAWWKTFRAALTGLRAFADRDDRRLTTEVAHHEASASANLAHGELAPERR